MALHGEREEPKQTHKDTYHNTTLHWKLGLESGESWTKKGKILLVFSFVFPHQGWSISNLVYVCSQDYASLT